MCKHYPINKHFSTLLFAGISLILVLLIYGWSLNGEFLKWDDDRFVADNPHVSVLSVENIKWAFSELRFESYQPLHMMSYMVDGSLWGGYPAGYKAHNLVLFYISGILLFLLLRRLSGADWAAALGALLFLTAPHRVESVAWISARKDLLALVLALLIWHLHLIEPQRRWTFWMIRFGESALFGLALLSKSSVFVLPFMMFLGDVTVRHEPVRKSLAVSIAPMVMSIGIALFLPLLWSKSQLVNIEAPTDALSRIGLVYWSMAHYLKIIVWPFALSPLYAAPSLDSMHSWFFGGVAITVILILAIVWLRRKRRSLVPLFGAALMFGTALAPFLNIVPMYYWVADRYLLFPAIGLSLMVTLIVASFDVKKRSVKQRVAALVLFALVVGVLSWRSASDATCWKDSAAVFGLAVKRQPDSFWAHMKLGEIYRGQKEFAASEEQYREARRIRSLSPSALGGVFWAAFEQDLQSHPELGAVETENVTGYFIQISSSPQSLHRLYGKLERTQCLRAAKVVRDRLTEMQ